MTSHFKDFIIIKIGKITRIACASFSTVFAHLRGILPVVVQLKQEEYGTGCDEQAQYHSLVDSRHGGAWVRATIYRGSAIRLTPSPYLWSDGSGGI